MCYMPHLKTEPLITCSVYQVIIFFTRSNVKNLFEKVYHWNDLFVIKIWYWSTALSKITQIYFILR